MAVNSVTLRARVEGLLAERMFVEADHHLVVYIHGIRR
jgi:hypothetical protein